MLPRPPSPGRQVYTDEGGRPLIVTVGRGNPGSAGLTKEVVPGGCLLNGAPNDAPGPVHRPRGPDRNP